jgi:hypothetical protein
VRFLPFLLGRRNPGVQLPHAWNGRAAICTHTPLSGNVGEAQRAGVERITFPQRFPVGVPLRGMEY